MAHCATPSEKSKRPPVPWQRITLFCASFLLLAALARAAEGKDAAATPGVWTLRTAVRFAVKNSPDSRMARQRIEAAQAAITMERASFYPRLDLNSRYDQTDNAMHSFGNILKQGAFSQAIDFNDPGRTDTLGMEVRLGYRFFNGGRDLAGLQAAEARAVSSRMEFGAVQAQLAFEVVRAFQLIVQAEELLKSQQAAVEALTASLAVAQARYQEGVLLKADLLDLEVQQAKAREDLSRARHTLDLSRRIFLSLLGLGDGPVLLDPAPDSVQEIPSAPTPDQRYELKSIEALILAARAKVRQAQGGYYPSLEGYAGYEAETGYVTDGSGDSWQAGVKLQLNLSEGGRTGAEIARASALLAEALERRRKTELAVALEVKQAELAVQEAGERLQVTEKSVAQAEESARINRLRFKEGTRLAADLLGVENRLLDARARRIVAETSQRLAVADLRRALGLPQFPEATETLSETQPEKATASQ